MHISVMPEAGNAPRQTHLPRGAVTTRGDGLAMQRLILKGFAVCPILPYATSREHFKQHTEPHEYRRLTC
jgi:hypothetical protein